MNDSMWRCLKSMNNFANKEVPLDQEVVTSAEKQQQAAQIKSTSFIIQKYMESPMLIN